MDFSLSPYAPGREMPLYNFGGSQETEEERRRRELQAQMDAQARQAAISDEAVASGGGVGPVEPTPIKETRTIDPTTGEVKLKIEGSERDLSAANPNTPTYSGAAKPVAPDDTFNRMIQAESGGRQTDAQGRVLTSNKGAMGVAQVLPTTAMQPGYGVPSIFDLAQKRGIPFQNRDRATAEQLLANRDLNQEFGANYYAAMNKRFDGGPAAVAAYNAGPGRVAQNMATNAGQLNVAQLPQETQGYLQKVGMPAQGVRPVAPGQEQQAQQPMAANEGIRIPGLTPTTQMGQPTQPAPDATTAGIQRFQDNQNNVDELIKMRNDTSVPEYIRKRSAERAYELLNTDVNKEKGTARVNEMVKNGDNLAIARTLTSKPKDEEGSWAKMILLGFLNPELAGQEAIKLGLGPSKWEQTSYTDKDGNQIGVEIKKRSDGKIMGGTRFDGTELTAEELNLVSTASPLGKGTSLSAEVYVDPKTGNRYRSGFDNSGKAALVNIQGGPAYRGKMSDLQIQSVGTAAQKAENAAAVKLRYAGPTSYTEAGAKAAGEFNFQNGTNIGYATQAPGAPLVDLNTGQPIQIGAGGVITTTQTGTPNAPAAAAGATSTGNLTPGDIARQGKIKEQEGTQFVKYASEDITPKADAGAQISRIRKEQLYGPDGILNNSEIAGILQGQGPASAEVANIFRDIITGGFKDQADLSQRVNSLGLNQRQKDVVQRQVGLMLSVNPLTLRANAGPGAVSDAEQKANREANVDILRQPLYSGLSLLTRDQFNKDMNVARAEFKAARSDLQTTEQFNSAWSSEKAKKEKEFDQIYAERAKYISKYNKNGENPGAIIDAYKFFPVPVFDAQTKTWDYGTEYSKKAARPKLNEFNK